MQIEGRLLAGIALLKGLSSDVLQRVTDSWSIHSLSLGQAIRPGARIHFVCDGSARSVYRSEADSELIIRDLSQGDMFGLEGAGSTRSGHLEIIALEPTVLASISRRDFDRILRAFPPASLRLNQYLEDLLCGVTSRFIETSTLTVPGRIHAELLRRADRAGPGTDLPVITLPTHAELANRIGTHREAITRELRKLEREKVISRSGRQVVIRDLPALQVARNRT